MGAYYAPIPLSSLHKAVIEDNPQFTDFHSIVEWYISHTENTSESISAKTGISVRTVISFRDKNAGKKKHKLKLLVAFAVGLHMTAEHALMLLDKNGQSLRDEVPAERYYKYLLTAGTFYCVAACNDFLVENKQLPLTDNENISSYD